MLEGGEFYVDLVLKNIYVYFNQNLFIFPSRGYLQFLLEFKAGPTTYRKNKPGPFPTVKLFNANAKRLTLKLFFLDSVGSHLTE